MAHGAGSTDFTFNYCFYWQDAVSANELKAIAKRNVALRRAGKPIIPTPQRCGLRFVRVQPIVHISINPDLELYIQAKKGQKRITKAIYDQLTTSQQKAWIKADLYSVEAHERAHACDFFEKLKEAWKTLIPLKKC